jgi:hypothetical protein
VDRLRGDPGKRCVESIGGKTRLLALIERPVEHGPSPRMRGASFVADGLNCVCVALNVEPEYLPAAVKGAAASTSPCPTSGRCPRSWTLNLRVSVSYVWSVPGPFDRDLTVTGTNTGEHREP